MQVDSVTAEIGDTVVFTVSLQNQGPLVTSIGIDQPVPAGHDFVKEVKPGNIPAIYDTTAERWLLSNFPADTTLTFAIEIIIKSSGEVKNFADIVNSSSPDSDATPDNLDFTEDDFATACLSVPIQSQCALDTFELSVTDGFGPYTWYKDDQVIPEFDGNSLLITTPGAYRVESTNGGPLVDIVCPVLYEVLCDIQKDTLDLAILNPAQAILFFHDVVDLPDGHSTTLIGGGNLLSPSIAADSLELDATGLAGLDTLILEHRHPEVDFLDTTWIPYFIKPLAGNTSLELFEEKQVQHTVQLNFGNHFGSVRSCSTEDGMLSIATDVSQRPDLSIRSVAPVDVVLDIEASDFAIGKTDSVCQLFCYGIGSNTICDTVYFDVTQFPARDTVIYTFSKDSLNISDICLPDSALQGGANIQTENLLVSNDNGNITLSNLSSACFDLAIDQDFLGQNTNAFQIEHCYEYVCDTTFVFINIEESVNTLLVAPDFYVTLLETPISGNVLFNDVDTSGKVIDIPQTNITASHGTVTLQMDGTFNYTPENGFTGLDSFTYTVCNGSVSNGCIEEKAIIKVLTQTDIPTKLHAISDYLRLGAGTTDSINVLGNDLVLELEPVVSIVSSPKQVNATVQNSQLQIEAPDTFMGRDTLHYAICQEICDTAILIVDVVTQSRTLQARNDIFTMFQRGDVEQNFVINDSRTTGLIISIIEETSKGDLELGSNGRFTYSPGSAFTGVDQFAYQICDASQLSNCSKANVYLNFVEDPEATDKPIAVTDFVLMNPNAFRVLNLKVNDLDDSIGTLQIEPELLDAPNLVDVQLNGDILEIQASGSIGRDSATYVLCDSDKVPNCDTGLVIIDVINSKDDNQPVAIMDAVYLTPNETVSYNFLTNDIAAKSLTLLSTIQTDITKGSATATDGILTYAPPTDFQGEDVVRYTICNAEADTLCAEGVIFLYVYEDNKTRILAGNDYYFGNTRDTLHGNVLENDFHSNGMPIQIENLVKAPNGTFDLQANGTFQYIPDAGFIGLDTFVYKVCDNQTPVTCSQGKGYIDITASFTQDTVEFSAATNYPKSFCLDLSDVGMDATIGFLKNPNDGVLIEEGTCLTYAPLNKYEAGTDTIITLACRDDQCDTSVYIFNRRALSCPTLFVQDELQVELTTCAATSDWCMPFTFDRLASYSFQNNGVTIEPQVSDCQTTMAKVWSMPTILAKLQAEETIEIVWPEGVTERKGMVASLKELEAFLMGINSLAVWQIRTEDGVVVSLEDNQEYEPIHFIHNADTVTIAVQDSTVHNGGIITLSSGRQNIVYEHIESGCQDSVLISTICVLDTLHIQVAQGGIQRICLEDFGVNGTLSSFRNVCDDNTTGVALATYDLENGCLELEGLVPQQSDLICLEGCDETGCYLIPIKISVLDQCVDFLVRNTAIIADDRCPTEKEICIPFPYDSLGQNYTLTYFADNSPVNNIAKGECTTPYGGAGIQMTVPPGQLDLLVTRKVDGCQDTMILSYSCAIQDFIFFPSLSGTTDTLCIDTDELPGRVSRIENICEEESGEIATFKVLEDAFCVEVSTFEPGEAYSCIVVCDDLGICDTTIVAARVSGLTEIEANPDTLNVVKNIVSNHNLTKNDTIDEVSSLQILKEPSFAGTIKRNSDFSIEFTPTPDYCETGVIDSFEYEVCNIIGLCDKVMSYVEVTCSGVQVMSGFSPNEDGYNDCFVIQGLEAYPNHFLSIYNRYGNLVYQTENYQNDWKATWNSGKMIPPGTYFYTLDLGDGEIISGYVEIRP